MKHPSSKVEITNTEVLNIFNIIYQLGLDLIKENNRFIDMYPDDDFIRAFGDGNKMKNICFYIQPLNDSVNVGFTKGTLLSKDFSIIKGTGKNYRHIKYKKISEVDMNLLTMIIKKAFLIH